MLSFPTTSLATTAASLPELVWAMRISGYLAVGFLIASISCSLIGGRQERPARWQRRRRWLGMRATEVVAIHFVIGLWGFLDFQPSHLLEESYLRLGMVAGVILLALWATSFKTSRKIVGEPLWKALHRLVYAVPFMISAHVIFAPFSAKALGFALGALACLVFGLRFGRGYTK